MKKFGIQLFVLGIAFMSSVPTYAQKRLSRKELTKQLQTLQAELNEVKSEVQSLSGKEINQNNKQEQTPETNDSTCELSNSSNTFRVGCLVLNDKYVGRILNIFSDDKIRVQWDVNHLIGVYDSSSLSIEIDHFGSFKKGVRVLNDQYIGTVLNVFSDDQIRVQWDVNKQIGIYSSHDLSYQEQ